MRDQRVCLVPNGDLFKAISDGSVDVVTDHIEMFTKTGLRLVSGTELEADIIVSATGLDLLFMGGVEATIDGEPLDLPNRLAYKGMMLGGVPNLAFAVGYPLGLDQTLTMGVISGLNRSGGAGHHSQ